MKFLLIAAALVATSAAISVKTTADKVKIGIYDESYCPYCRQYVSTQVGPVYDELSDIMTVHFCTYGWASDKPDGDGYTFQCQHGPEECEGNKILGCAHKYIKHEGTLVDYYACFMGKSSVIKRPYHDAEQCASEVSGVDYSKIETCAKSSEGEQIAHDAGKEFNSLNPMPKGVPYVTLNGKGSDSAYADLKKAVCHAYQGTKPPACN